jgi:hypothetical protein
MTALFLFSYMAPLTGFSALNRLQPDIIANKVISQLHGHSNKNELVLIDEAKVTGHDDNEGSDTANRPRGVNMGHSLSKETKLKQNIDEEKKTGHENNKVSDIANRRRAVNRETKLKQNIDEEKKTGHKVSDIANRRRAVNMEHWPREVKPIRGSRHRFDIDDNTPVPPVCFATSTYYMSHALIGCQYRTRKSKSKSESESE